MLLTARENASKSRLVMAFVCAVLSLFIFVNSAIAQTGTSPFTTHYRYDDARRLVGTISADPYDDGTEKYNAVRMTYDSSGRLIRTEKGVLSTWHGVTTAPASWTGFTVHFVAETEYDEWGREKKSFAKSGSTKVTLSQTSYDGFGRVKCNVIRMNPSDFNDVNDDACVIGNAGSYGPDRVTKTLYDDYGRVTDVKKAVGTSLEQTYQKYAYNSNHTVDYVLDANGNKTKYEYDVFNRLKKTIFPSKTTVGQLSTTDDEHYTYDNNGNMLSFINRANQTISYEYDDLNRLDRKLVPEQHQSVFYTYDNRGLELKARYNHYDGMGITNTYDGFGNLTSTASSFTPLNHISYQYDLNGNRTRVTHSDGVFFSYKYDGLNRLDKIFENSETSAMLYQKYFAAKNMPSWIHHMNRFIRSYGANDIDAVGRITRQSFNVSYNGTTHDLIENYTYNPASQLTSRTLDNSDYLYEDDNRNITGTYVPNGLNQYHSVDGIVFDYDDNGNLHYDGVNYYTYDSQNRLVSVSGDKNATLKYDPYGRLYEIVSGTQATRFVYDGNALVEELNGSNTLQRRYMHEPGVDTPLIWYEGSGTGESSRYHLLPNRQGSIIAVSMDRYAAPHINSYDAYGIPNDLNEGRFSYTGQAYLNEIGLMYYKARMYNPKLGRFMQTDPIGYDDQMNLYSYVMNDPLNNIDPNGKQVLFIGKTDHVTVNVNASGGFVTGPLGGTKQVAGVAQLKIGYGFSVAPPFLGPQVQFERAALIETGGGNIDFTNTSTQYGAIVDTDLGLAVTKGTVEDLISPTRNLEVDMALFGAEFTFPTAEDGGYFSDGLMKGNGVFDGLVNQIFSSDGLRDGVGFGLSTGPGAAFGFTTSQGSILMDSNNIDINSISLLCTTCNEKNE